MADATPYSKTDSFAYGASDTAGPSGTAESHAVTLIDSDVSGEPDSTFDYDAAGRQSIRVVDGGDCLRFG